MTPAPTTVAIEYVGPIGAEMVMDGQMTPLTVGERYSFEKSLADYLCRCQPDHWRKPEGTTKPAAEG